MFRFSREGLRWGSRIPPCFPTLAVSLVSLGAICFSGATAFSADLPGRLASQKPVRVLRVQWAPGPLKDSWAASGLPVALLEEVDRATRARLELHAQSRKPTPLLLAFSGLQLVAVDVPCDNSRCRFFRKDDEWFDALGCSTSGPMLARPIALASISSSYGARLHPILDRKIMHEGVDYAAPVGTPVWAVGEGTVIRSGTSPVSGNHLWIRHDGGYVSRYLHLTSKPLLRTGERASLAQTIGFVGATGRVTGPHLHFELRRWGRAMDPLRENRPPGRRLGPIAHSHFLQSIQPIQEALNEYRNIAN